ncbi:MAG TPA: AtpZ/AtpI family protein [Mycobacteriales bacterium]|jgi:F0F1-type ATP synthase assembly protein I|nr:AtpZ/AtpI family protein [Mycobacteriales bacterium]
MTLPEPSRRPPAPNLITLLGIGAMLGICVAIGLFLGVLVDHFLGTSPLVTVIGLLVGIFGGLAGAYQVIRPYVRPGSK